MITLIIADDHALVRGGIRALLEKAGGVEIIAEAQDGAQALELVERLQPDILLVDIAMPRMDGMQVVQQLRARKIKTRAIVLSMYSDRLLVRQALRDGARGYLIKDSLPAELLIAVRAASRNQIYLSPAISDGIVQDALDLPDAASRATILLSPREREVLQLIAEGKSNPVIAKALQISVKTVDKHRASLMRKLDAHNLPALLRVAIQHQLVFYD